MVETGDREHSNKVEACSHPDGRPAPSRPQDSQASKVQGCKGDHPAPRDIFVAGIGACLEGLACVRVKPMQEGQEPSGFFLGVFFHVCLRQEAGPIVEVRGVGNWKTFRIIQFFEITHR